MDRRYALPLRLVALPLLATACVESSWTVCADGQVCPPGRLCDDSSGTCADEQCLGKDDGTACGPGASFCRAGVCGDSCGDGIANGTDQCDGSDLGGWTCESQGIDHYHGNVACLADCTIDSSGCSGVCGDGIHDTGFERCEPATFDPLEGETCFSHGFDAGRLGCASDCKGLSEDPCMRFGWILEHPAAGGAGTDAMRDIWGTSDELFVLLAPGGVRSRVQGWAPVGDGGASIEGRALWARSSADIWVVDEEGDGFLHGDGTTWVDEASPVRGLNEIWGSSSSPDIFAVGDRGAVVHFDGTGWEAQRTPEPASDLRAIWGNAGDDVYAAGEGGSLLHYDGSEWSAVDSETTETLIGVWASSTGTIWTISDTAVRRLEGGQWSLLLALDGETGGPGWVPGRDWISGTGSSDVWISAGTPGKVRRYDGTRWSTVLADDIQGAQPLWVDRPKASSAAPQVAVGFQYGSGHGAVGLWYGAGVGPRLDDGLGNWSDVWALDQDTWFAGGADAETFGHGLTLDSNGEISVFALPIVSVTGFSPDRVYAADQGGTIWRWDGGSWSEDRAADPGTTAIDLWTSGSSDLYALVNDDAGQGPSRILRSDGHGWAELPAPDACGAASVDAGWATSPEDIFVAGIDILAHFDGTAWSCFDDDKETNFFRTIWGSGPDDVWVEEMPLFSGPEVMHHWNGTGWTTESIDIEGDALSFGGLVGTARDDVFLGDAAHYDGRAWLPLHPAALGGGPVFALPSRLFTKGVDGDGLGQFIRTRFWNQRAHEVGCSDGVDDDGDGLTDQDDPDCANARRREP